MRLVARAGAPLVTALTRSTTFVFRLLGLRGNAEPGVTEHDIRALVEQGAETGVVQETEREIVENVFRLGDRSVNAIMTPRPDVEWVDLAEDAGVVRAQLTAAARERTLVCDRALDRVVGFVHAAELLPRWVASGEVPDAAALRELARPPLYVPATTPAFRLLETFRRTRQHAAVVLDEYGAVAGVATLDDLLEALVGDVPAEGSDDRAAMTRRPDGSWLVDASTPIEDVESRLDLEVPEEERGGFLTLGGFVMARLGHVPRAGESFEWGDRRVEVVAMDGRRVETVLISTGTPSGAPGGAPQNGISSSS
jgi:putative hemolysin